MNEAWQNAALLNEAWPGNRKPSKRMTAASTGIDLTSRSASAVCFSIAALGRRTIRSHCGPSNLTPGGSASSPDGAAWWAGLLRSASSPGALEGVLDDMRDVDVRPLLPRVLVPRWCIAVWTAQCASRLAGTWRATYTEPSSSNLRAPTIGFSPACKSPESSSITRFVADLRPGHGLAIGARREWLA